MGKIKNYLILMRPHHYIKNVLIFVPLLFSGSFFDLNLLYKCLLAFFVFSFGASVVYIINDIRDKEKDKIHEVKKNRPIASGKVNIREAIVLIILLGCLSYLFSYLATDNFFDFSYLFVLIYILINIFYSFGLKNIPLLDIAILVLGFLLRVLYGAFIVNIKVSNWLYLTIISLSFYLILGKRRNEIQKNKNKTRKVLQYYNESFLDKNMYMCLALAIVFYALWTVDPINVLKTNNLLIWTVPLIILILMKYSLNIEKDNFGDPIDVILSDKVLLFLVFLYVILIVSIIYFI